VSVNFLKTQISEIGLQADRRLARDPVLVNDVRPKERVVHILNKKYVNRKFGFFVVATLQIQEKVCVCNGINNNN
jgi:hypothetical protein